MPARKRLRTDATLALTLAVVLPSLRTEPAASAATVLWNTDASGLWMTPSNWSSGAIPGAVDDVVLDRPSANPTITFTSNQPGYGVRSLLVNETLELRDTVALNVATTTTLNASMRLMSHGQFSGGTINAGNAAGQIVVPTSGYGQLANAVINAPMNVQPGASLSFAGAWRNNSVLTATNASIGFGGVFRTDDIGTFNRTGGNVTLQGQLNNTGRTLALNAATGTWDVGGGGKIVGGTVAASDGARLDFHSGATLDGVTLQTDSIVHHGTSLRVQNGLTLNHSVITAHGGNSTNIWFQGSQTLGGTGHIHLNSNVADMYVAIGSKLTIGPGVTIHGGGAIHPNGQTLINRGKLVADFPFHGMGIAGTHGTFHNQGIIEAATNGHMFLSLGGPNWSNTGVIRVSGGTIGLVGTFNQQTLGPFEYTSGTVNVSGTITNLGKTLALSANTGSWTLHSCTVEGGRVTAADGVGLVAASSSIYGFNPDNRLTNGVVLDAPLTMPEWSRVTVTGGLVANRAITLAGDRSYQPTHLDFDGSQTLAGSGEVVLNAASYNFVRPITGTLTIGPAMTIRTGTGGGTISNAAAGTAVVNQGTISAETASRSITVAGNFTNNGTIEARNGGWVDLSAAGFANLAAGTLTGGTYAVGANSTISIDPGPGAAPAAITTNDATILLDGPNSNFEPVNSLSHNLGHFSISGGRDFAAKSAFTNAGTLAVGAASDFAAGNFSQSPDAALELHLGGLADEQYGQLTIGQNAALDGSLILSLADSFLPDAGDRFEVIAADSLTGVFDTILQPPGLPGHFRPLYHRHHLTLLYVPARGRPPRGSAHSELSATVPEPTTILPVASAALALSLRRTRRNGRGQA